MNRQSASALKISILALAVAALTFVAGRSLGLGASEVKSAPPLRPGSVTVEDVKAVNAYPIFWLGESYKGLPLVSVHHNSTPPVVGAKDVILNPQVDSVTFVYGSCEPRGNCAPPVQITSTHACLVPPIADDALKSDASTLSRGAVVLELADGQVRFVTREAHVSVFDMTAPDQDRTEKLDALVPFNTPAVELKHSGFEGPAMPGTFEGSTCPAGIAAAPVPFDDPAAMPAASE